MSSHSLTVQIHRGANVASVETSARPGINVLVVDDDPDMRANLCRVLERRMQARIRSAASGEEALPLVERHAFDAVVADYKMDAMTGAELLGNVQDRQPGALRILVTAHDELTVAVEAVNLGHVHAFIQKPWTNDDLVSRIERLLAERRETVREHHALARAFSQAARSVASGRGGARG